MVCLPEADWANLSRFGVTGVNDLEWEGGVHCSVLPLGNGEGYLNERADEKVGGIANEDSGLGEK